MTVKWISTFVFARESTIHCVPRIYVLGNNKKNILQGQVFVIAYLYFSIPGEKLKTDPYRLKRKFSTRVEDLDYLPLDLCHQYLKVSGPEIIKRFSCSAQLRLRSILLINVKMPTISLATVLFASCLVIPHT